MTELFVRTHLFLARHRVVVVLAAVLLAAATLLFSRRLKLNEDYTDMLPMSDPAIAAQVEALKHIRQADRLFVDVQTIRLEPEVLGQAADQMGEALQAVPELSDVRCRIENTDALEVFEELQGQLPLLFSAADLRGLENRLDPAALEKRLAWFKKALSQPQGLTLQAVLQRDPVGLGDAAAQRLQALQAGVGDARIVNGRITSADGRHVLVSALPSFRPSETGKSRQLIAKVLAAARQVEQRFPGAVRIAVSGAHRVSLDNATMIREDSTRASVIATLGVALLLPAVSRRRWLSLLGLAPTLFGGLGALAVFAFTGEMVSAVALGCGSILIGVTVDYGIYLLYQVDDRRPDGREALARVIGELAPTLVFGALTTMAAFLVMFASPVSGHRQLGVFGALGVLLAAAGAIIFLPVFFPATGSSRPRLLPLTSLVERFFAWRDRHAKSLMVLVLLISIVCGVGLVRLRFDGDLARFNGMTRETQRDEQALRDVWGKALSLTTVVVGGTNREEALENNEKLCAILRELQGRQIVDSFSSLAPLLPSKKTRQANLRDWRDFWTDSRCAALSNELASAATGLGFRAAAFSPFWARLAAARETAPTDGDGAPALTRLLGDYCTERDGHITFCTLVKANGSPGFHALQETVTKQIPGALLLNKTALGEEITRIARRGLPVFGLMVAALNALMLYLFLGRIELAGIVLLPMAAGVFWTLGLLGLCGLPVDLSNFIFVVFVLGVGGDYSLFLLMAELGQWRGWTTGGAGILHDGIQAAHPGAPIVAQTSKSAVSRVSKPADCTPSDDLPTWPPSRRSGILARREGGKPATQQVWKPALPDAERAASSGAAVALCALTTIFGVGVLVLAHHPALFSIGLTALLGISLSLLATLVLVPVCATALLSRAARVATAAASAPDSNETTRAARVRRLYRYQEPYVTQFVYWKMRTDPLFHALDHAVPPTGRILDLGCGYGLVAHWLTLAAPERTVTGIDCDAEKIRAARATTRFNPRTTFDYADVLDWDFPACDVVLLCDLLHYLPSELKLAVLRKACGALRPGGKLVLRDAARQDGLRHRAVAWAERCAVALGQNRTKHGLHFETAEGYIALLRAAGFTQIEPLKNAGLGSNIMLVASRSLEPSLPH